MAISPQQLTIYLYSAHRAVIFAIAQLSCYSFTNPIILKRLHSAYIAYGIIRPTMYYLTALYEFTVNYKLYSQPCEVLNGFVYYTPLTH